MYYTGMARRPLAIETREAALDWITERFGAWEASLTEAEREALAAYKRSGYKAINRLQREDELDMHTDEELAEAERHIAALDHALSRYTIPESIIVYRGIADPFFAEDSDLLVPGTELHDAGYLSTSLVRTIAEGFLGSEAQDNRLLRIALPAGLHAIHAAAPDLLVPGLFEAEILLPAGTRLLVRQTPAPDDHLIDLEALP